MASRYGPTKQPRTRSQHTAQREQHTPPFLQENPDPSRRLHNRSAPSDLGRTSLQSMIYTHMHLHASRTYPGGLLQTTRPPYGRAASSSPVLDPGCRRCWAWVPVQLTWACARARTLRIHDHGACVRVCVCVCVCVCVSVALAYE
ncbi:hypothetical protein K505DRAFT_422094 [Melanomma pulvis-pyrius CBS 109.77]|uniref:Uncharacterized protein n=1 Tax=Melanomma pulvis-pyrius CBS 109.77 TaxID=1314802 RepID=A0A6A6WSK9_9PLEO|nr:hypothetical protein K505DRAFT_422094 [Melanomma pulvis-pyrius CBS 109.77]